jgi:methionyl-tRNA formyltransferase
MRRLNTVYFGTPYFAADLLEKIITDKNLPLKIHAVVTKNDSKVGKKRLLTPSPVKELAKKYGIDVLYDYEENFLDYIKIKKIDLALLFAYGQIIPKKILKSLKYGFWIVHPSLLPKYKGAFPFAYVLINNEEKTGVTLIQADEGIDTGEVIGQKELLIGPNEKRPELIDRLVDLGYELVKEKVNEFITGNFSLKTTKQKKADYPITKKLKREQGFVTVQALKNAMTKDGKHIYDLFRGLYPWPGIWTLVKVKNVEKRLKITDMELINGKIKLKKVQLEGKNVVDFETFNLAYKIFI